MADHNQPTLPQQPNNNRNTNTAGTFAHYKILAELGRGGMGCVYKAFDTRLQRVVALKVLIAQDQAGAKQIQRFLIEAQATAKLVHPNIVRLYEIGNEKGTAFFTMDYINGVSLKELIKSKKLKLRAGVKLMKKVSEAMHHAHQKGIIHRDLKPANIMVDEKNEPFVMDFGLAKMLDSDKQMTKTGTIMGTLFYMPPEQAEGQHRQIDQRSDIYSLGAILYEIVTGKVPHFASSTLALLKKITLEATEPPSAVKPRIPKALDYICLKTLAKKKEERYEFASELAQDLENFVKGKPVAAAKGRWYWNKTYVSAIGVAVVFILLVIVFVSSPSQRTTNTKKVVSKKSFSSSKVRSAIKKRTALIIGNANYDRMPLQNTVNDAIAMSKALENMNFRVLLLKDANQVQMGREIRNFGDALKQRGGVGLFYYAGHGVQIKGVNYLIPVDSRIKREDEVAYKAINAGLVLSKMESANTAMNLIFLDACRDNPFASKSRSTAGGLARMDVPYGSLIAYATAPGKTASDGEADNGVFTKHLLQFIKEPGLEIGKMLRKVRKAVRLETNNDQIPWDSSSLEGDFYFTPLQQDLAQAKQPKKEVKQQPKFKPKKTPPQPKFKPVEKPARKEVETWQKNPFFNEKMRGDNKIKELKKDPKTHVRNQTAHISGTFYGGQKNLCSSDETIELVPELDFKEGSEVIIYIEEK